MTVVGAKVLRWKDDVGSTEAFLWSDWAIYAFRTVESFYESASEIIK
jgi:hypothetical protein